MSTLIAALSCSSKDKSCAAGDLRCRCYPNETCNDDLVCLSNVCVEPEGGGEGGTSPGAGGKASTSGGRADEEGGSTGEGSGGSAKGGAAATTGGTSSGEGGTSSGEGGTPSGDAGAGGATSTGGTATTGGVVGTGGKATSGGASMGGASSGGQVGVAGNGEGATSGTPDGSLIINGDFSDGDAHWKFTESSPIPSILTFGAGRACIKANGALTNFNLGFPLSTAESFTIEPGFSYTVSYRAAAIVLVDVTSKVGLAVTPYTSISQKVSSVGSTWSIFTHTFTPSSGSTAAGFVLSGLLYGGNEVCFDDVSLVMN